MRIALTEVGIWVVLWLGISLAFGYFYGGHAWTAFPFIGTVFGLVAGTIYSAVSIQIRIRYGQLNFLMAVMLGLLASVLPGLLLNPFNAKLIPALIFVATAGSLTGVLVNFAIQKKYKNGTTS